jgi:hypothetical protein
MWGLPQAQYFSTDHLFGRGGGGPVGAEDGRRTGGETPRRAAPRAHCCHARRLAPTGRAVRSPIDPLAAAHGVVWAVAEEAPSPLVAATTPTRMRVAFTDAVLASSRRGARRPARGWFGIQHKHDRRVEGTSVWCPPPAIVLLQREGEFGEERDEPSPSPRGTGRTQGGTTTGTTFARCVPCPSHSLRTHTVVRTTTATTSPFPASSTLLDTAPGQGTARLDDGAGHSSHVVLFAPPYRVIMHAEPGGTRTVPLAPPFDRDDVGEGRRGGERRLLTHGPEANPHSLTHVSMTLSEQW